MSVPSTLQLEQLNRDVLHAALDSHAELQWGNVTVRRYRDDLYALTKFSKFDETKMLSWELPTHEMILNIQGMQNNIKELEIYSEIT